VAPVYFGGAFTMIDVNGGGADSFAGSPTTADPNNWRYYRYRVYERVIPLKNMLWALPP
jgi:type IV pilus assembly protein PilW